PPPFPLFISGSGGPPIDMKGFNFHMFAPQPKTEEQQWESWLFKAAKQVQMKSVQVAKATQMLQEAKKDAAAFRQKNQKEFSKLVADKKNFFKSQKFDKQVHKALEEKAETLHLELAKIGEDWKSRVRWEVLTSSQRERLMDAGKKELPQGLGIPGFWNKPSHKKGFGATGFEKHH